MKLGSWLGLKVGTEISEDQAREIRDSLTFKIFQYMAKDGDDPEIVVGFKEDEDMLWIPRMAMWDKKLRGILKDLPMAMPDSSTVFTYPKIPPERLQINSEALEGFRTRGEQVRLIEGFLKSPCITQSMGGILQSPPGSGKTVMGSEIIARLGMRTVILVHKEFLFRQWIQALALVCPDVTVSVVRGVKKVKKADITIAMIQTLISEKFQQRAPDWFWRHYGVVACDEIHRYGARRWSECLTMFDAPLRIGFTATPRRKDGTTRIFKCHIGPVVVEGKNLLLTPKIKRVLYNGSYQVQPWMREKGRDGKLGRIKRPFLEKLIVAKKDRDALIARQVVSAWKAGRKVMVMTSRREHAETLKKITETLAKAEGCGSPKAYLYYGQMKKKEYEEAEDHADIIFGTYQMAQEGLDVPRMDVMVLAMPRSDVEQTIGRVLRDHPHKPTPVVVDVIDRNISDCIELFNGPRRGTYIKYKASVERVEKT